MAACENVECDEHNKPIWFGSGETRIEYTPSTNWAQGGPIIEREGIATLPCPRGWAARVGFGGEYIEGPTPLIAAMRCFVASKLGDEVDVPEELA